ncbi:MAG TPA: hypothetical protein PLF26_05635 [Blastocatellia bacterium]|nr:hypothetical protein [Blastocatellia bacterium]
MNADFEVELEALPARYRPRPTIERRNVRLEPSLLWLATPGDAILTRQPWPVELRDRAEAVGVSLVAFDNPGDHRDRQFSPWGWTPSAIELARRSGASADHPPVDVVARVNSKLFSHALERELGIEIAGATVATTLDVLHDAAARACPGADDKWVVKGPFGFNARERVLGRGPAIDEPSARWATRRFARGQSLVFEPWLDVSRELGVQLDIGRDKSVNIIGISTMRTNGAGVTTGFVIGEPVDGRTRAILEDVARSVGERLAAEGYFGPANVDALEHSNGLRPLLEINARHSMGLVALAAERELRPRVPILWNP